MEAVGNDPLVKEPFIGMPFELMACCLEPSWPGYAWIKSAATARIQRSFFITKAVKVTIEQKRAYTNEARNETMSKKAMAKTR